MTGHVTHGWAERRELRPSRWTLFLLALAGMFLTYVWRVQHVYPILAAARVTFIVSALGLILFLVRPNVVASLQRIRQPTVLFALLLLLWMVISIPGGVYPGHSFRFVFFDFTKTFLFMVIAAAGIRNARDLERVIIVLVTGGLFFCAMSLMRGSYGPDGRLGGIASYDANDLCLVVAITLPLAIYMVQVGGAAMKVAGLSAAGVFAFTIVQTVSRGGFLTVLAVSLYMLFQLKVVRRGVRFGIALVAILGFSVLPNERYREQIATILNPTEDYNWSGRSAAGRMEVWKRGVGYMISRPLTGVGAGAFGMAEGSSDLAEARARAGIGFKWSTAHNAYIQIGAELGFPGLAFFLLMLGSAFYSARKLGLQAESKRQAALGQLLSASMVAYAANAVFLSAAYIPVLFGLLGIMIAFVRFGNGQEWYRPAPAEQRHRSSSRQQVARTTSPTQGHATI